MIVDAHCHVATNWYQPVESLLHEMDRAGVDRAILIQILGRFDNHYQQACVRAHPDRLASVVAVDVSAEDASAKLAALIEDGIAGIRLRPGARSPAGDPLAIWRQAACAHIPISCVGPSSSFLTPDFLSIVTSIPDLVVVLEHLGGIARPDAKGETEAILALARYPNIALKIPGLGQLAPRRDPLPAVGIAVDLAVAAQTLRAANTAFGTARLMWGSDFPPVAAREGYANALHWAQLALADLPPEDLGRLFGQTAAQIFRCHDR